MLKCFKYWLLAPFIALAFALTPGLVFADCATPASTAEAIQCGTDNSAGASSSSDPNINPTITNVINLISVAVGIAAVIMIIIGGFRYITSAGNQESVKSAKNTIVYAIIGLVIVALAQVIVRFVLNKATQAPTPPTPPKKTQVQPSGNSSGSSGSTPVH